MKDIKEEFKKFITRGNVIDLAVGVIMGSAFSKIVSSLVDDVIMPFIGMISGGIDFTNLSLTIGDANIKYGAFIQNTIDFLIIAFCIFLMVKFINRLTRKKEEKPAPPKKSDETKILEEIRDLLKDKNEEK